MQPVIFPYLPDRLTLQVSAFPRQAWRFQQKVVPEHWIIPFLQMAAKPSSLNWASSNTAVAAVDGNGKVTPVGTGSAEITLTSDNGTKGTCQVTVTAPAEGITLSDKTLTLAI